MQFHQPSQTVVVEAVGRPMPVVADPADVEPETDPVAEGRGSEPEPAPRS